MATTVKYGSKGDDVKNLQSMLNQQGYQLTADGIFGDKTQEAVRDYQKRMGLTVDGIVGTNTWGALNGGSGASTGAPNGTSGSVSYSGVAENPLYGFEQLMADLDNSVYQQRTPEQLQQAARDYYTPIYNAERLSQQQLHDQSALALEQQLAQLAPAYDRQREDTQTAYAQAHSASDRQALSRGMQRSSYNNQTLANIDTQGARAQNDISAAQTRSEEAIFSQQTLLARQLAEQVARIDTDLATQIASYAEQLATQDYDRYFSSRQAANTNAKDLYQLGLSQSQWAAEFAESQRQFNESLAASQKSSGSSSSSPAQPTPTDSKSGLGVDDLLGGVYGGDTGSIWGVNEQTTANFVPKSTANKKKKVTGSGLGSSNAIYDMAQ